MFAERSDAPVHSACRIERANAGSSRTLSDEAPAALDEVEDADDEDEEDDDEDEDEEDDEATRSEDFCSNCSARMRFRAARARSAACALPGATHASSSVFGLCGGCNVMSQHQCAKRWTLEQDGRSKKNEGRDMPREEQTKRVADTRREP